MEARSFRGGIYRDRRETDDRQNLYKNWRFQNYAYRSPSGQIHYHDLSHYFGRIVEYSLDAIGSQFIQMKLETATIEDKHMVFQELQRHALALTKTRFGSHVIIKFFEHGLDFQRRELAAKLFGHVYTLSFHLYGNRVIQKALEVVDMDQKIRIVRELNDHVVTCLYDHKANKVIEKCIECVPEEHTRVIVSVCIDQIVKLAQLSNGVYFIKTILMCCNNPLTQKGVLDGILPSVVILANHPSANYLVQFMVKHGRPEDRSKIFEKLAENIVEVCLNQFGSLVIQNCWDFSRHCDRKLIVNAILGSTDRNEPLQTIVKDMFGMFVVRKVLNNCDVDLWKLFSSRIKIHRLGIYLSRKN